MTNDLVRSFLSDLGIEKIRQPLLNKGVPKEEWKLFQFSVGDNASIPGRCDALMVFLGKTQPSPSRSGVVQNKRTHIIIHIDIDRQIDNILRATLVESRVEWDNLQQSFVAFLRYS